MNIYDISNKAGVSIATVSRVINGSSNVSEQTRNKVLNTIKECGYTPNVFARGLGLNSMRTIGMMCVDASDPHIACAIKYLERELRINNYDSLLCSTGYNISDKQKSMDLLLSKRTDAIILVGSYFAEADDSLNQYIRDASAKVPIIIINGAINHENVYSALCDDHQAVFDATRALQKDGRYNILYLYNAKSFSGEKKLSGFLTAMDIDAHWASRKDKYVQFVQGDVHQVKDHITSLYKEGLPIDAIITADDLLAVSALKFAKENKISVPDQLSIIGYNNSIISQCCDPEITSIDNKLEALCCNSIATLMGVLRGQEVPTRTVFYGEIIKRGTTRF